MKDQIRYPKMAILGMFFVIIIIILALPYLAQSGVVSSDTSTMLISTSESISSFLPWFVLILLGGFIVVIIESR